VPILPGGCEKNRLTADPRSIQRKRPSGEGRAGVATVRAGWIAAAVWLAAGSAAADETLYFPGHAAPVRVVRGGSVETVTFRTGSVTVVRGAAPPETAPPVTVIRGGMLIPGPGLFDPRGGELDRIAFAVEGVESGHGTNPLMWRPAADGPQGPMQVSAAAALDVGGGDRFDPGQNRRLGRAFLARLYRRYGNWPDALAAYNWGPGNVDAWIAAGRPEDRLPPETARYIETVLRDALIGRLRL